MQSVKSPPSKEDLLFYAARHPDRPHLFQHVMMGSRLFNSNEQLTENTKIMLQEQALNFVKENRPKTGQQEEKEEKKEKLNQSKQLALKTYFTDSMIEQQIKEIEEKYSITDFREQVQKFWYPHMLEARGFLYGGQSFGTAVEQTVKGGGCIEEYEKSRDIALKGIFRLFLGYILKYSSITEDIDLELACLAARRETLTSYLAMMDGDGREFVEHIGSMTPVRRSTSEADGKRVEVAKKIYAAPIDFYTKQGGKDIADVLIKTHNSWGMAILLENLFEKIKPSSHISRRGSTLVIAGDNSPSNKDERKTRKESDENIRSDDHESDAIFTGEGGRDRIETFTTVMTDITDLALTKPASRHSSADSSHDGSPREKQELRLDATLPYTTPKKVVEKKPQTLFPTPQKAFEAVKLLLLNQIKLNQKNKTVRKLILRVSETLRLLENSVAKDFRVGRQRVVACSNSIAACRRALEEVRRCLQYGDMVSSDDYINKLRVELDSADQNFRDYSYGFGMFGDASKQACLRGLKDLNEGIKDDLDQSNNTPNPAVDDTKYHPDTCEVVIKKAFAANNLRYLDDLGPLFHKKENPAEWVAAVRLASELEVKSRDKLRTDLNYAQLQLEQMFHPISIRLCSVILENKGTDRGNELISILNTFQRFEQECIDLLFQLSDIALFSDALLRKVHQILRPRFDSDAKILEYNHAFSKQTKSRLNFWSRDHDSLGMLCGIFHSMDSKKLQEKLRRKGTAQIIAEAAFADLDVAPK